jgi:hypothetical protein
MLCPHQEANCKNHRVNRVVYLGNMKRLLTTGVSRWNTRQIALWDQVSSQEAGRAQGGAGGLYLSCGVSASRAG